RGNNDGIQSQRRAARTSRTNAAARGYGTSTYRMAGIWSTTLQENCKRQSEFINDFDCYYTYIGCPLRYSHQYACWKHRGSTDCTYCESARCRDRSASERGDQPLFVWGKCNAKDWL